MTKVQKQENPVVKLFSDYFSIIVLIVAAVALWLPATFSWMPTDTVNWLLCIVMFGMGLTLRPRDFKVVFAHPKAVITGDLAQFTVMPFLAWSLCKVFDLPVDIAIGVILVGCCPGGTASNVMTYLAGGDVALSVGMTGISTLLAPIMTPFLTYLLAGKEVDVDLLAMIDSVFKIVFLPIVLGFLANHYFGKYTRRFVDYLPVISALAIAMIIGVVVGKNAERVLTSGLIVIVVVMLLNLFGLLLGYHIGKLFGLDRTKCNAIAIEVGMQNSGLATVLAQTNFAMYPLATIPGALFTIWHNFSGSIAANIMKPKPKA